MFWTLCALKIKILYSEIINLCATRIYIYKNTELWCMSIRNFCKTSKSFIKLEGSIFILAERNRISIHILYDKEWCYSIVNIIKFPKKKSYVYNLAFLYKGVLTYIHSHIYTIRGNTALNLPQTLSTKLVQVVLGKCHAYIYTHERRQRN
mgnify:CR=1 FL=1